MSDSKPKDAASAKSKAVQPHVQTATLPGAVEDGDEIQATWCLISKSIWLQSIFCLAVVWEEDSKQS